MPDDKTKADVIDLFKHKSIPAEDYTVAAEHLLDEKPKKFFLLMEDEDGVLSYMHSSQSHPLENIGALFTQTMMAFLDIRYGNPDLDEEDPEE